VSKQIKQTLNVLTSAVLRIPQGLFFSKNHTWVYLEKNGNAKIGMDDFLHKIVGEIQIVPLKSPGDKVQKGDVLAEIHQSEKKLKVLSPVSGEIISAQIPEDNLIFPESDPYDGGWFYSLKPANWKAETSGFYLAEEATTWINKELVRFKDFLNISMSKHSEEPFMMVLQEGGELCMNPLSDLKSEIWDDFQKEFME
jgi:glycine cleavage system H protein